MALKGCKYGYQGKSRDSRKVLIDLEPYDQELDSQRHLSALNHLDPESRRPKEVSQAPSTRGLEIKSSCIEIPIYLTLVYMILDPKA